MQVLQGTIQTDWHPPRFVGALFELPLPRHACPIVRLVMRKASPASVAITRLITTRRVSFTCFFAVFTKRTIQIWFVTIHHILSCRTWACLGSMSPPVSNLLVQSKPTGHCRWMYQWPSGFVLGQFCMFYFGGNLLIPDLIWLSPGNSTRNHFTHSSYSTKKMPRDGI